jgi:hypothetical protein
LLRKNCVIAFGSFLSFIAFLAFLASPLVALEGVVAPGSLSAIALASSRRTSSQALPQLPLFLALRLLPQARLVVLPQLVVLVS